MQRMIDAVVIKNILEKYQTRLDACHERWDRNNETIKSIGKEEESCIANGITPLTKQRKDFIAKDFEALNIQIGTYECFIKDLKKLLGESDEVR